MAVNLKRSTVKKIITRKKLQFHIDRVETHIEDYLQQLDTADKAEKPETDGRSIEDKITWLKKRLSELKSLEGEVNSHPDKQLSTTDPDSRLMKTQGMTRVVCYNVQTAVDTKNHLIVAHEMTNKPDRGQLCRIGQQAQDTLDTKGITVIADKGYYSGQDIKDTQDAGMTVLVPKGDTSGSEKKGIFNRSRFQYNAEKDVYVCPADKELKHRLTRVENGLTIKRYFLDVITCRECSLKSKCSNSKEPRRIARWAHQDKMDRMDELMASKPETMLIRKQTVEHPYGTIKCWMGATHFLTRRFKNVSTEMNLHVLAYNLKRTMTIFGEVELMAAMTKV